MVQVPLKDYTYANARVRAMNSRLLDEHVYKDLLDAPDYNQALGVLENTEYQVDIEQFILEGALDHVHEEKDHVVERQPPLSNEIIL